MCLTIRLLASYDLDMENSDDNPYAPPVMGQASHFLSHPGSLPQYGPMALRITVADFRSQSRALAGTAFFFGLVVAVFPVFLIISGDSDSLVVPTIGVSVAVVFFFFGIGIARKSVNTLKAFLISIWILILLSLVAAPLGWPFSIVFGLVAAQCHRVLRYARIIRAVGVPLTAKPHEIPLISP